MCEHPTITRCRIAAQAAGSSATTIRGIANWLKNDIFARKTIWRSTRNLSAAAWREAEKQRKADPDAKRARKDKAFRRRYLAALRRCEQKAIKCDATNLDDVMRYNELTWMRIAELHECARLRSIVTGKKCEPVKAPSYGAQLWITEHVARDHGAKLVMRGRDARVYATKSESWMDYKPGETEWENGKAVRYTRARNDNYVRSLAVIRDPQTVDYICHETRYEIKIDPSLRWEIDENGLKAVVIASPGDDYHPTAACLIEHLQNPAFMMQMLMENMERRARTAAENAATAAENKGVFVCLADSIRGGNCEAGSRIFAQRHQLDVTKHYGAMELLAQANGDARRVRLAITAARIRHEREVAQGFCVLAEHNV